MKTLPVFLSGSLMGVCITVGVFYLRGPFAQHLQAHRATGPKPAGIVVPLHAHEASLGSETAPVTMIEYSDFQCRYSAMFRTEVFPKVREKYIDTGQLRFVRRNLPLRSHGQAMIAANAAACAAEQGRYWQFSDVMSSRPGCLECQGVMELSKAVPLDRVRFEECVSSGRHQPEIDQDIASARQLQFQGTPSFVVGRSTARGVEGVAMVGALAFEEFATKIDRLIGQTTVARH